MAKAKPRRAPGYTRKPVHLDAGTHHILAEYAAQRNLTIGAAVEELVRYAFNRKAALAKHAAAKKAGVPVNAAPAPDPDQLELGAVL